MAITFLRGNSATGSFNPEVAPFGIPCAFPGPNIPGDCIIVTAVVGEIFPGAGSMTISDTAGNTYVAITAPVELNNVLTQVWYALNIKFALTNTVSVAYNVGFVISGTMSVSISEYVGVATVSALDSQFVVTSTSNSDRQFPLAVTGNTTQSGDLVFLAMLMYNVTPVTLIALDGYLPQRVNLLGTGGVQIGVWDAISGTIGAQSYSMFASAPVNYGYGYCLCLKPALASMGFTYYGSINSDSGTFDGSTQTELCAAIGLKGYVAPISGGNNILPNGIVSSQVHLGNNPGALSILYRGSPTRPGTTAFQLSLNSGGAGLVLSNQFKIAGNYQYESGIPSGSTNAAYSFQFSTAYAQSVYAFNGLTGLAPFTFGALTWVGRQPGNMTLSSSGLFSGIVIGSHTVGFDAYVYDFTFTITDVDAQVVTVDPSMFVFPANPIKLNITQFTPFRLSFNTRHDRHDMIIPKERISK